MGKHWVKRGVFRRVHLVQLSRYVISPVVVDVFIYRHREECATGHAVAMGEAFRLREDVVWYRYGCFHGTRV